MVQRPREQWNDQHARWVEMFFRDICRTKPKPFRSMGHFHKWMYDDVSLDCVLESLGFRDAQRRELHDSRIPAIEIVEVRDDLIVEAVR